MIISFLSQMIILIAFMWSFSGKLIKPSMFIDSVEEFNIVSSQSVSLASWTVIILELIVILMLISSQLVFGFFLVIGLLSFFSIILITVLKRRMKISCGCFGPSRRIIDFYDVVRNIILILVAIVGIVTLNTKDDIKISLYDQIILTLFSFIFVLMIVNIGEIIKLLRQPTVIR